MAERQDKVIIGKALIEKNKKLLGRALVEKQIINEQQLNEALKVQARTGELLGVILIKMDYLTEEDVAQTIADSFDLEYIDLEEPDVESYALESIPSTLAQRHGVLPLRIENNTLHIACDKPPAVQVLGNLRRLTGKQIVIHIATTSALWDLLKDAYEAADSLSSTASISSTNPLLAEVADEEAELDQSVIELLDEFIAKALRERASDIHFESAKERLRVRFRVDGILREIETYPPEINPPLISRIKVLSNLNIAEKRAPQDGGFTFENPFQTVDIRVSILPNIYGEKAVLRLLTAKKDKIDFEHLGMEADTSQLFMSVLKRPHGLILLAGPTGSGKSTTLYASLLAIRSPGVNITTVEDPVEYKIEDITQVQVDQARKITFENALRSILRQDPDIIMVGEIRDRETAEISLQASLTGHLVLATIHTNDAPSALVRLVEMGCESFLVSSAVSGVMSQRLVRINCDSCKQAFEPTPIELERFGYSSLPHGAGWARSSGCRRCDKTGYRGRIGIFECFKMDKTIRQEVIKESSAEKIKEIAIANGMRSLLEDGLLKVNRGQTSPEEILRVTVLE